MENLRILLVGESETGYQNMEKVLSGAFGKKENYALTRCGSYAEAINAMLKSYYDVYLVNDRMDGFSGIDLLHEAIRSNCTDPVIILSEGYDAVTDERAMSAGAAGYFVKNNIIGHVFCSSIRYALKHYRLLKNLKESEDKFRIIFERSKDPMFISDISGRYYDVNDAALSYLETTREEFMRSNAEQFYPDKAQRIKFVSEMEGRGSVTAFEMNVHLPGGKVKYCSISSFLQISQHGASKLYYNTLHDLTHRRKVEQEVMAREKRATSEHIARELANEIRNPLTNVNFAMDEITANLGEQDRSVEFFLNIVKENCERINVLTDKFYTTQLSRVGR